jgi:hypothetical protein
LKVQSRRKRKEEKDNAETLRTQRFAEEDSKKGKKITRRHRESQRVTGERELENESNVGNASIWK